MEALYVCKFSNGHIKVGRSSAPQLRIRTHAERVACLGITLDQSYFTECPDSDEGREQALINRCVDAATFRHQREWFAGLQFADVCKWAYDAAHAESVGAVVRVGQGEAPDFRSIVNGLRAQGMTQADIAGVCQCDQSSISDISTGRTKDPRYSVGAALIALSKAG